MVKTRLRKAEQEYIIKEMDGCRSPSSQWKLIRSCLPRKETTQHVYTREVKEIVEEFNDFFVSVGIKHMKRDWHPTAQSRLSPPL